MGGSVPVFDEIVLSTQLMNKETLQKLSIVLIVEGLRGTILFNVWKWTTGVDSKVHVRLIKEKKIFSLQTLLRKLIYEFNTVM